ncbi:major facilitator superfamily protein [Stylonychia lemnae]|uniref:Major facilitator superfamily protein n=1 Tax=Stylonychia lemnae TaxID=5949 RepID=A0A078B4E3_STYLE|nr:major facilitator superfamily protein [Stylonychia lemnae]|eukprot:CDW88082.1 major facilitator superfamily protein [Stylonychia lemnae]
MDDSKFFYEKDPYYRKKVLSIIGCMLCQFIFGQCNIWGNIQVYVCSYLRQFDDSIQINQIFIVAPIQSLSLTVGNLIGTKLINRFKPRTIMTFGFSLFVGSQLLASFAQNLYLFILAYSLMGGIGLGMNFFLPVYVGWKCFPMRKGLITSMIMCFNGIGTITQSIISVLIVNPNNIKPTIQVEQGVITYNYFDEEVSGNIPLFFRIFTAAELVILAVALTFIWIPPYNLEQQDEIKMPWHVEQDNNAKLKIALSSRQFFQTYIMMFTGVLYFQYVSIAFKSLGEFHGHDDQFLTLAASLGMIFNVVARTVGGMILDKLRFKYYFGFILLMSITLSFTFNYFAQYKFMFLIFLAGTFFISGSVFVSTPVFYGKVFGPEIGSQAYAYFFTSNAIAVLSFSYIVRNYQSQLGYEGLLLITGVASTISFIDLVFLSDSQYKFSRYNLLDDVASSVYSGPHLSECSHEFASASFLIRKDSYVNRASNIRSHISMSILKSQLSDISLKRHAINMSDNRSGFGDYKQ